MDELGILIDLDIEFSQIKALMERCDNRRYSMSEVMAKSGADLQKKKHALLKSLRERRDG
ncbi:hypothetical protein [Rubrimonas cliftonensis]|uniref:hypothetical protein n=1 Tax=Rubrimonas cliftonensis TaxID=89524 RepID=UPI000B89C075|nr:hypothetical protein [Rubrimonas cliftonensis]